VRGAFQPKPGEAPRETVARCYPALIAARRQSYEALAHCTLQVAALRDGSLDARVPENDSEQNGKPAMSEIH